jgi:hypothetical protein
MKNRLKKIFKKKLKKFYKIILIDIFNNIDFKIQQIDKEKNYV